MKLSYRHGLPVSSPQGGVTSGFRQLLPEQQFFLNLMTEGMSRSQAPAWNAVLEALASSRLHDIDAVCADCINKSKI